MFDPMDAYMISRELVTHLSPVYSLFVHLDLLAPSSYVCFPKVAQASFACIADYRGCTRSQRRAASSYTQLDVCVQWHLPRTLGNLRLALLPTSRLIRRYTTAMLPWWHLRWPILSYQARLPTRRGCSPNVSRVLLGSSPWRICLPLPWHLPR